MKLPKFLKTLIYNFCIFQTPGDDPPTPGPAIFFDTNTFTIKDRGEVRVSGMRYDDERHVLTLLSFYYVMDYTYPKAYGNLLGLLQEKILLQDFNQGNKSYYAVAQSLKLDLKSDL